MRSTLGLAVCVLFAGCATAPEQDPVVQKMAELDSRLLRIERVMTNQSLLDLSQKNEALQNEIRTLRGQLDELQHNVNRTQTQLREQYSDVDRRITTLESGGTASLGSVPSTASSGLPVPQGDDRANYQAAFDLLKDGKYPEATAAFKQFLATFPDSVLADNAHYWLGESYYVTKQFGEALKSFRTVTDKYPASRKMPDALLKIGYCNYELKNWADARGSLTRVVQQYGDTTAARLASERLAKMGGEGR